MTEYKVLVLSDCEEGSEAEYSNYYDTQHIPDILRELPEVQAAQRFQVEPVMQPAGLPRWRFSCLYTVETGDFSQYLAKMQAALREGKLPPSSSARPNGAAIFKLVPLGDPILR